MTNVLGYQWALKLLAGLLACLALIALVSGSLPGPPEWLEGGTKWIGTMVGLVVSARLLWSGAAALSRLRPEPPADRSRSDTSRGTR
jgi:peptidoglycan/LPS O-acetylase OafA/YrhL